ncbi:MAG: hypothetical protein H6974_14180 [Gammaproteobacteria bacterium]|nr:hypothetical protein [Gammaproteobacteria bacterium]
MANDTKDLGSCRHSKPSNIDEQTAISTAIAGDGPLSHSALNAVINMRVTRQEKMRLRREAQVAGLTISALGRRRCCGYRVDREVNWVIIEHLRRVGLETQRLDAETQGNYRARTDAILHAVEQAIHSLVE